MGENMLGRTQREQLSHAPAHFGERRAQLVRRKMAIERRQLPQTGEQTLFGSLPQTDKLTAAHNKHGAVFHSPRLFCGSERQHSRVSAVKALAEMLNRAVVTARCAVRQTDGCTKLHQRLVEVAGAVGRHECGEPFARLLFEFCVRDRCEIVIQPRRHTQNIAVHRRNGQSERDRRHRACRVLADAGQSKQPVVISRQFAAVFFAQQDRCTVQVAHAAVVAEPLPELGVNGLVRRRESGYIGQRVHPAGEIAAHGLHARLLEHDLAHPDAIGSRLRTPRQVAVPGVIPVQQRLHDGLAYPAQYFMSSSVAPV